MHEPNTKAVSKFGINLRPLLDDFAQIVGTVMKNVERDVLKVATGLKTSSAVFIRNEGALCLGCTKDDAEAVAMITEKTCKTLVGAALFNHVVPISWLECFAMRLVYKKKYSKEKNKQ